MSLARPGVLCVRSVNEYRRCDTLAYLGLRYYLANTAARSDFWAREVATDLVLTRTKAHYFRALHFKDSKGEGQIQHREMFLPTANEALAEASLLSECARRPEAFGNHAAVFSYVLNSELSRTGVFKHYMGGVRERHRQIACACDDVKDGVVQYVDIKRFYPSIKSAVASVAWKLQCETGKLSHRFRELGDKLIADHVATLGRGNSGILTGPMFSHLLANLVLREIDGRMSSSASVKYFRYVDDITLVGERAAVKKALETLHTQLTDLDLTLHEDTSPKNIIAPASDWLAGRHDFHRKPEEISWPRLIHDLRRFLLVNPDQAETLQATFRSESLRIPVRDYSAVSKERQFLERALQFIQAYWYKKQTRRLTIGALVHHATLLREKCETELTNLLEGLPGLSGYPRKRRIPRLRYCVGRLIYLSNEASLVGIAAEISQVEELYVQAQVMRAVATGEVDDVLPLGTNAAQAAAQPMRAAGKNVVLKKPVDTKIKQLCLATFLFNGIRLKGPEIAVASDSEVLQFAMSGSSSGLMRSTDGYLREIACLHGLTSEPRHGETLRAAFDKDEELALDAINQIQQSAYA